MLSPYDDRGCQSLVEAWLMLGHRARLAEGVLSENLECIYSGRSNADPVGLQSTGACLSRSAKGPGMVGKEDVLPLYSDYSTWSELQIDTRCLCYQIVLLREI